MTVSAKFNSFGLRIGAKMVGKTPDTCSIRRRPQTDDDSGGWGGDATPIASNVPCRFSDGAGMENLLAGAQQGFLDGVIFLPARFNGGALGLLDKDLIDVNVRGLEPLRTFEVIGFGPGEGVLISAMVKAAQS